MVVLKYIPKLVVILAIFLTCKRCLYHLEPTVEVAVIEIDDPTNLVGFKQNTEGILYAINEINNTGGIKGHSIKPLLHSYILYDPYRLEIPKSLLEDEQYKVIFGCWTPFCRRSISKSQERKNLLIYSGINEGFDDNQNTIFASLLPNQLILPAIDWMVKKFGNRLYLIEADNIHSTIVTDLISEYAKKNDIEIVAVKSIWAGAIHKEEKMKVLIKDMVEKHPDVIVNLLTGDENIMLFRGIHALLPIELGIKTLSFNLDENTISHLGIRSFDGTYIASNFFEIQNPSFSESIKNGTYNYKTSVKNVSFPFMNGYNSVYIWKKAVDAANSFDPQKVLKSLPSVSLNMPTGEVTFNNSDRYISAPIYIGKVKKNGEIEIVWKTPELIRPDPFPSYLSKEEWIQKVDNYYLDWNSNWFSTGGRQ